MKKTKLLIVSLLLLTGSVLSSCNEGETSSSSVEVEDISIKLPKEAIVGDVINLDDYVSIISDGKIVTSDYTAVLTTIKTATLDGHILTITNEGNVTVKISCGGNSAKFAVEAIVRAKAKLREFVNATGNKYYVDNIDVSSNSLTHKGFVHNSSYFAYCNDPYIFGDDTTSNDGTWSGMLKKLLSSTYNFTMDDIEGTNLNVLPGKQLDISYWQFNTDIALDYNDFEPFGDDLITYDTEVVDEWMYAALSTVYTPGECDYEKYGLKLEFKEVNDGDETVEALLATVFVYDETIDGEFYNIENPYTYITSAVLNDEKYYKIEALDKYVKARTSPTPISDAEIKPAFEKYREAKAYTMETSLYYSDLNGNVIDDLNLNWPVEEINSYFNENGFLSEYADGSKVGIVNQNDKIYQLSNIKTNEDETTEIVSTISSTKLDSDVTDVWSEDFDYYHYFVTPFTLSAVSSDINVLSRQDDEDFIKYEIGLTDSEYFYMFAFAITPGYGTTLYNAFVNQSYIYYCTAEVVIANDYVILDIVFSINDWQYHIKNKFCNIGEDKLTDKISSVTYA